MGNNGNPLAESWAGLTGEGELGGVFALKNVVEAPPNY